LKSQADHQVWELYGKMNNRMIQNKKTARIFDLVIAISIGIFLIGNILHIQHFPFGREITILSMISLAIITLIVGIKYLQRPNRKYLDTVGLLIVLLIICIQFNKWLWFTKMAGLVCLLLLLAAVWFGLIAVSAIRKKTVQFSSGNKVIIVGLSCLIGEVILRSNQLPMGTVCSMAGLLLTMIGSIVNYSRNIDSTRNFNEKPIH
jgi:hypothetical protein